MKDYLHKLHQMKLFSLQNVTQLTHNESTAKSFLSAGIKNGTICRVKMNLYVVTDLATMRCAANKYEIPQFGWICNPAVLEYKDLQSDYETK